MMPESVTHKSALSGVRRSVAESVFRFWIKERFEMKRILSFGKRERPEDLNLDQYLEINKLESL